MCALISWRKWFGTRCVGILLVAAGQAQVPLLITVDVSNPAAVTFTATGNAPSDAGPSGFTLFDGVVLSDFLSSDVIDGVGLLELGSTLTPFAAQTAYEDYEFYPGWGLNLFHGTSQEPQQFALGQPAFTGSATADLSAYSVWLPSAGAFGEVLVGEAPIGYWQAIPEPAAWGWVCGASVGIVIWWSRRRQRADRKSR